MRSVVNRLSAGLHLSLLLALTTCWRRCGRSDWTFLSTLRRTLLIPADPSDLSFWLLSKTVYRVPDKFSTSGGNLFLLFLPLISASLLEILLRLL